jgi:hypothetical protein
MDIKSFSNQAEKGPGEVQIFYCLIDRVVLRKVTVKGPCVFRPYRHAVGINDVLLPYRIA